MRLYPAKFGTLSTEIVRTLRDAGDIECAHPKEVEADVHAVLDQYARADRELGDKTKDLLESRGLPSTDFSRMKKLLAEQAGIKIGDEMLDYVLDQIVEILLHSNNVDEVFAEDVELRRKMAPVLKRHLALDDEIEREVSGKLKHVQEGTRTWEVEHARIQEEIRRRKGV